MSIACCCGAASAGGGLEAAGLLSWDRFLFLSPSAASTQIKLILLCTVDDFKLPDLKLLRASLPSRAPHPARAQPVWAPSASRRLLACGVAAPRR